MATIIKRGKSYRIRVYAGYDIEGKQIERTMTWTPPSDWSDAKASKEAQRQAILFEEQIRNGGILAGKIKFSEFSERWMTDYAIPNLKPKTVVRYNGLLKRINRAIGHIDLTKLQPQHLLKFYASLSDEAPSNVPYHSKISLKPYLKKRKLTQAALSKETGVSLTVLGNACRGQNIAYSSASKICEALKVSLNDLFQPIDPVRTLSDTTIQHYHRLISDILNDAVKWGCIPFNPCTKISSPRAAAPDILYLDDQQAKELVELLRKAPGIYRRAVLLLLLTGMRRGELLGLEWHDIDWNNKCIYIRRTSQYLPSKGVYTDTTKTKTSNRLVLISDQVIMILRQQHLWQRLQADRLGVNWVNSGRIVVSEDGTPMHPDRLTRWFSHFIAGTDLPPIHLHSLRHTYASLCISKGIPLPEVSAQLGHANVATTARIYTHSIRSARIAAADKIGGLFADLI